MSGFVNLSDVDCGVDVACRLKISHLASYPASRRSRGESLSYKLVRRRGHRGLACLLCYVFSSAHKMPRDLSSCSMCRLLNPASVSLQLNFEDVDARSDYLHQQSTGTPIRFVSPVRQVNPPSKEYQVRRDHEIFCVLPNSWPTTFFLVSANSCITGLVIRLVK